MIDVRLIMGDWLHDRCLRLLCTLILVCLFTALSSIHVRAVCVLGVGNTCGELTRDVAGEILKREVSAIEAVVTIETGHLTTSGLFNGSAYAKLIEFGYLERNPSDCRKTFTDTYCLVTLTEKAKQLLPRNQSKKVRIGSVGYMGWCNGPMCSQQNIVAAKFEFLEVTGIADAGLQGHKEVRFRYNSKSTEIWKAFSSKPNGVISIFRAAVFRKFDDGWRLANSIVGQ